MSALRPQRRHSARSPFPEMAAHDVTLRPGLQPGDAAFGTLSAKAPCRRAHPLFCRAKQWGLSSAGRAPDLHSGGQRFDPARLHHFLFAKAKRKGARMLSFEERQHSARLRIERTQEHTFEPCCGKVPVSVLHRLRCGSADFPLESRLFPPKHFP